MGHYCVTFILGNDRISRAVHVALDDHPAFVVKGLLNRIITGRCLHGIAGGIQISRPGLDTVCIVGLGDTRITQALDDHHFPIAVQIELSDTVPVLVVIIADTVTALGGDQVLVVLIKEHLRQLVSLFVIGVYH